MVLKLLGMAELAEALIQIVLLHSILAQIIMVENASMALWMVSFYQGVALNQTQIQQIYNAGLSGLGKCVPMSPTAVPTKAPVVPTEAPIMPTEQPTMPTEEPMTPTPVPVATEAPEVPTQTMICNGDKPPGAECDQSQGVWVVADDVVIQPSTNILIETSVVFQGNVNLKENSTIRVSSMATLTFQKCPTFNDSLNIVITEVSETLHTVLTIPPNCDVSVIDETTVTSDVEDECSQFSVIETQTKLSVLWATDRCNDSGLSNGVIAGIAVAVVLVVVVIAASLIYYFTFHGKRTFVI
mmetsp:Transcript_25925/g.28829  ORF Transcript_25925/g.28829 Transcript_25925/m.28829 type:complete len:298 (+) Transcript_25925:102-995(+)